MPLISAGKGTRRPERRRTWPKSKRTVKPPTRAANDFGGAGRGRAFTFMTEEVSKHSFTDYNIELESLEEAKVREN